MQTGVGIQGSIGSGTSAQQQAARKVTRMCMIIATTFSVAWLPYQLTRIVMTYGNSDQVRHSLLILNPTSTLSYVNSCVNPIVYGLMWRPFRMSLIEVRSTSPILYRKYKYGIRRLRCDVTPKIFHFLYGFP